MRPGGDGTQDEDFGSSRSGDLSVLRYERRLAHPSGRRYGERHHGGRAPGGWFPTTIEGERRCRGASALRLPRVGEGEPFDGEMLAFVPPSLMELRWADDVLRFELEPDGPGCMLRLTVTFPEHGKAARDAAGWHVCLDQLASSPATAADRRGARPTAGASSTPSTSSGSAPRHRPSGRPRSGSWSTARGTASDPRVSAQSPVAAGPGARRG